MLKVHVVVLVVVVVAGLFIPATDAQTGSALHQPTIVVQRQATTVAVANGDFAGAQRQAFAKLQEQAILDAALDRTRPDPEAQETTTAVITQQLSALTRVLPQPRLVAATPDPANPTNLQVEADVTVDLKAVGEILRQRDCLEDWQIAVRIPEVILEMPPPPDPAVETELNRQLVAAKFTAIDIATKLDAMQKEIEMMEDILGPNRPPLPPQSESYLLGADILVKGEAFAQGERRGNNWYFEARVEYKAVFVDTGQIISSDAFSVNHTGGAPAVVAKDALQKAAEKVSQYLIQDLLCLPVPDERRLRVAIYSLKSARDLLAIETLTRKIPGVTSVKRQRYTIGMAEYVVSVKAEDVEAFPLAFVGDELVEKLELEPVAFNKVNVTLVKTAR